MRHNFWEMATPQLLLIAGISCSGKTTLASELGRRLDAVRLSVDDYYRPYENLTFEERRAINFDAPDSIDVDGLVGDIRSLLAGQTIHKPQYSFSEFTRVGYEPVYPGPFIVLEGLFALYWNQLNELANMKVFVQADSAVCLARRLERDAVERGRSEYDSMVRYRTHVEPNQQRYVLPTQAVADRIVSGETCLQSNAQMLVEQIAQAASFTLQP